MISGKRGLFTNNTLLNARRRLSLDGKHDQEVLSNAAVAFLLRGLGAGLAFTLNVVVGRLLGAEGAGLYFLALSLVTIASVLAKLGIDNSLLRFISSAAAREDRQEVGGIFQLGFKLVSISSLSLSLMILVFASNIAQLFFAKPELTHWLQTMSLAVFFLAIINLLAESLKALKLISQSMLVSGLLYPLFALILIYPFISLFGPLGVCVAYVCATGCAGLAGWFFWREEVSQYPATSSTFSIQILWNSCRPLWLMSLVNRAVLPWTPLFLLGMWGTSADIGVFGAATRISMLMSFFLLSVNIILAPKFSELYTHGKIEILSGLGRRFTMLITIAASPLFILLVVGGDWVMGLFGAGFARGGDVLSILAIGQAVNTLTGPVGYVLMMSGNEKDLQNSSLLAAVLMALLGFTLIPVLGMVGAAIASAVSTVMLSLITTYFVWYRLDLLFLPFINRR